MDLSGRNIKKGQTDLEGVVCCDVEVSSKVILLTELKAAFRLKSYGFSQNQCQPF